MAWVFSAVSLVLAVDLALPSASQAAERRSDAVPDQYIVRLNDSADADPGLADRIAREHGGQVLQKYRIVNAFAATVPLGNLGRLMADPRVAWVEPDVQMWAFGTLGAQPACATPTPPSGSTQTLPWGIDRIDAECRAVLGENQGNGIKVAVIDTGIQLNHPDLVANIAKKADGTAFSVTFVSGTKSGNDDNGHGTHVSGIIAAADNAFGVVGVAPKATLYAVKVLNRQGRGTLSQILAGVDWAANNGMQVANMSLGGSGDSQTLHDSLLNAKAKGVTVVVAAGNEGTDAGTTFPARYDDAVITVSATDSSDNWPSWSNYGAVVDLAAPGVSIYSTYKGSAYRTLSGTSMATPHVAGAAALAVYSWIHDPLNAAQTPPTPDQVELKLVEKRWVLPNTSLHSEDLVYARDL